MNTKYLSHTTTAIGCLLAIFVATTLTSCNDFLTIYPTDKTVGADFWKKKGDVEEMVNGAYKSMLDYSVQERAIVWGAYRSDELVKFDSYSDMTLDNISALNLLPTNRYSQWGAFYKVINNCNIVLKHAPEVMELDPDFTLGDYQVVRAQMLALRSLCYFYLVRAFRDVPYVAESFEDDSQTLGVPQSAPDVVLQNCLDDLAEAEKYIMKSGAYGQNDWRNWGYMTRDAVRALMADIYLWRAAMTHNAADYQQCINYIDQVIADKDSYYKLYHHDNVSVGLDEDIYHLADADKSFTIFTSGGNSHESILEWQYNGLNNSNEALENYYYQSGNKDNYRSTSILMASQIFASIDENANTPSAKSAHFSKNDYRFWNNVYDANNDEAQQLSVRKMVDNSNSVISTSGTVGAKKTNDRRFTEFSQNWIVYRLTDLMLMKAEALTELAVGTDSATMIKDAFDLVNVVNKRSMLKNSKDLLKLSDIKSKSDMEHLVLAERERELCFEGKRWFDLVRYSYRHMEGVDIHTILYDQDNWPAIYQRMINFVVRKYPTGGDAVAYKMKTEPYLYWPLLESEVKVNGLLHQNPVYVQEKSTSKN